MTTAELFFLASTAAFALSGLCLLLAVIFWFRFRIPEIIGDLSGRTAKKSIAKMRSNNESTGNHLPRSSSVNAARGKITEPIRTERLGKNEGKKPGREKKKATEQQTALLTETEQTALLTETEQTALLTETEQTAPLTETGQTTILTDCAPEEKEIVTLDEACLIFTNEVLS